MQLTTQLKGLGVQTREAAVVGEARVVATLGVVNHGLISGVEHVAVTVLQVNTDTFNTISLRVSSQHE